MVTPAKKSKYLFLDPEHLESLGSAAAPLDGMFPLLRPKFEPKLDMPALSDGEPPTEVGWAVMEFWAAANSTTPDHCPTGVVRAVEAVGAWSAANATSIRSAMPGNRIRWIRNPAGRIAAFTIEVLVPMVGPATVQPRGISRATRLLRDRYDQTTIHEIGDGLVIEGLSGQHLANIRDVQREVLDPKSYTGRRQDFVDSLGTQGILEPLRGFTFELVTPDGRAYSVENDDGTTRTSTAQEYISILTGGLSADLSRRPWENGDGTVTPRDWTPDAIRAAYDELRFDASDVEVWPPIETAKAVATWADAASPTQQAIIRMMTAHMTIGVRVEAIEGNTSSMVVWSDMARFHDVAHQPSAWAAVDNEAFKARTIVSDLAAMDHITAEQRAVMLGETEVPWRYSENARPFTSRVEATVDTMVQGVVEDPDYPERYTQVRETMKRMRVAATPASAAAAIASLAAGVAGLTGSGEVGAFTAMLKRSYKNQVVRRIGTHRGDEAWSVWLGQPLEALVEAAGDELDEVIGTQANHNEPGPAQRALALLAMAAHGSNHALIDYTQEVDGKTVRLPSSMTINGRGGRVRGGAADAHVIVFNMTKSPHGIRQLEAIVAASIEHDEPAIPRDPVDGQPLIEDTLRRMWAKTPAVDGTPQPIVDGDEREREEGSTEDDDRDPMGLSTEAGWAEGTSDLRDDVRALAIRARMYREVPAGWQLLDDVSEEEWDPDDEATPRMLHQQGIDDETAEGHVEDLAELTRFFTEGLMAWLRRRAGL